MPRQRGTLHPARKGSHARKSRQVPEGIPPHVFPPQQRHELLADLAGLLQGPAADSQRHQRSRRQRNGTALPFEAHVLDDAVARDEIDGAVVAAQRISSFADCRCSVQFPPITGPGGVIEERLLVEVGYTPHMPSHSFWIWSSKGNFTPLNSICSRGRRER